MSLEENARIPPEGRGSFVSSLPFSASSIDLATPVEH